MRYVSELIETTLSTVRKYIVRSSMGCGDFFFKECGYKKDNNIPEVDDSWKKCTGYMGINAKDMHFWIRGKVKTPDSIPENTKLMLAFETPSSDPQTILYVDGKMKCGLDPNHKRIPVECGREYDVAYYVYMSNVREKDAMPYPRLYVINEKVEKLSYDMGVPFDAARCYGFESPERKKIFRYLEAACLMINKSYEGKQEFFDSLDEAQKYMDEEFYGKACGKDDLIVKCIGHTHIDVAWLWTIAQTEEKVQRSFATALELMERYPEYKFMMTQPQLYQFMKKNSPELYEEIKKRIEEGRWEAEGAMWLESDCNIPSGESFVRQLIRGKSFIRDEYGTESKTLWIPDVFGYSAALPQILKKADVENFVTGKISWNDTNKMPQDTFYWRGIDGTEIFTFFITSFNGNMTPEEIKQTYDRYKTKTFNETTLHPFGFGDGGGGATAEMLERYRRLNKGIPGIPKTEMTTLSDYLDETKKTFDDNCEKLREIPRWDGELYLEFHRGTYTNIAKVKRNNRKAEFALRDAEETSVIAGKLCGTEYPFEKLDNDWETVSLNQFHDIIPGSSIKEVYERSEREYAEVLSDAGTIVDSNVKKVAENIRSDGGYAVFNMNSAEGTGIVELDGKLYTADNVPGLGYAVKKSLYDRNEAIVSENSIDNRYFSVKFDENGFMTSVYDKLEDRELLREGEKGNRIVVYEDFPTNFDGWEISHYTRLKGKEVTELVSVKPYQNGAAKGLSFEWKYNDNIIRQNIVVYDNIPRIDVFNNIDIAQKHIILKALFPFDVRTTKTVSEIQFGNVERPMHMNTSWDEAKFETCMHKWVDVSDNGYGVSILNDCKYGFSSYENTIGITMIKSAESPYDGGDCTNHRFTYSIYPHKLNAVAGGTVEEAYRLNDPMKAVKINANKEGTLPETFSLVTADKKNIVVEAVKRAEKSSGTVFRIYDAYGMASRTTVKFGFNVNKVYLTNLLEEKPVEIPVADNSVTLDVRAFDIITLVTE